MPSSVSSGRRRTSPGAEKSSKRPRRARGGGRRAGLRGRGRLDGWVHGLPAPGGRCTRVGHRRRLRTAPSSAALGPARPRARADERALLTELPFAPDLVVCDVSFISVTKALPPVLALARPGWEAVVLVKPQFEAGRAETPKGVVRDPEVQRNVLSRVTELGAGVGWTHRRSRRLRTPGPEGEPGVLRPSRQPSGRGEPR